MPERAEWEVRAEPEELPELMDGPCSYEEFRACLRDLGQVNLLTLGYRPTLRFLEQVIATPSRVRESGHGAPKVLRILDVGCGGGDMLRRIARWARKRGVAVELTGIDINPFAARVAEERDNKEIPVTWLTGDAFSHHAQVDVIISSLLTHHLSSAEVVLFLEWMEAKANSGWFINDLERSPRACFWFRMMARSMRWHSFVQHDGSVSFRRSFQPEDWQQMLAHAGVPADAYRIEPWRPGRLCVARWK